MSAFMYILKSDNTLYELVLIVSVTLSHPSGSFKPDKIYTRHIFNTLYVT